MECYGAKSQYIILNGVICFKDCASNLDRPAIFRLNIGVSKDTYRSLFGPQLPRPGTDGVVDTGHDFTALDQLLSHPNVCTAVLGLRAQSQ